MKIVDIDKDLEEFLQFVATKKGVLKDWQFLHVIIQDPEKKLEIDEIEQFLEFQFQSDTAWLLRMPETNEILLFTHMDDSLILSKFEKAVYENFSSDILRARVGGMGGEGLSQFSKILVPYVQKGGVRERVLFTRMSRLANTVLVLDDDTMILKQIEKMLMGFGNVVTLQTADKFDEEYKKIAPDILFLDIHLQAAKGNEILKDLKKNIDPYAHVVMISSDTKKDMIMDVKGGGAAGFVVKPINRNNLYQHIFRAPTIIKKSA